MMKTRGQNKRRENMAVLPVAAIDVSGDAEPHIPQMVVRKSARHQLASPVD